MTEENDPDWTRFFDEAVEASNNRVHKVLYGKAPADLYDEYGGGQDESAEVVRQYSNK